MSGEERGPGTRRRALRRWLLLAGVLPLLLCVALALKVGVMLAHDRAGRDALADGAAARARDSFAANRSLNLLQPWVAPYDEGVARFTLGDHGGAVVSFEAALADAPSQEQCRVRVNLALSLEAVGDQAATAGGAAGDPAGDAGGQDLHQVAQRSWQRARDTLAGGDCVEPGSTAAAVDARLREKQTEPAPEEPDPEPAPREPSAPQEQRDQKKQQQDELGQRNDAGEARRANRAQKNQQRADAHLPATPRLGHRGRTDLVSP